MTVLRALIRDHRQLALLLLLLAFAIKALIPAGYMIGTQSRSFTVEMCGDGISKSLSRQVSVPIDGQSIPDHGGHKASDSPCAFTSLSMASLGGADAPLLALALAFILALGVAAQPFATFAQRFHLRPPLRAPPVAR